MVKKLLSVITIIFIVVLVACHAKRESIEGYWMAENGETVSFNSDGKAIIEGIALDYSIYNDNYISVTFLGFAEEYKFSVKNDVLTLKDLSTNETIIYYRSEEKQTEIQRNITKLAEEAEKYNEMQQKLEAEIQAQEEYENYILALKSRRSTIDDTVVSLYEYISEEEKYISENKQWILEELQIIEDYESEISELSASLDNSTENQIDALKEQIDACFERIDAINEKITTHNDKIIQWNEEIGDLEKEKEKITKELKQLGVD